jgi:uncharacterized membrane protein YgcG
MEPNNSPQDDAQLRELLREWQVAPPPASLEGRVLKPQATWWGFLFRGYIRVPVPVACCLAVLLLFAGWRVAVRPAQTAPCSASCNNPTAGAC